MKKFLEETCLITASQLVGNVFSQFRWCWLKSLLCIWLIWKLSGFKVSAKIDRTSFSIVLTIFTFTLSTIYSFSEVYFTSITSLDGAEIPETKKFRKFSSITQVNALQTSSLLLKFHWHPDQTQSLNRGFNTLLRTGTLIKRRAVQAEHSDRSPWYKMAKSSD